MKILPIVLFLTLASCNIKFGSTDKYHFSGGSSKNIGASIKYSKNGNDSLRVRTSEERFIVALPQSSIRFNVICKTTEDIILQSFDKTKILIFVLKTKKWSEIKQLPKDCPQAFLLNRGSFCFEIVDKFILKDFDIFVIKKSNSKNFFI